jgi:hypothetical protein
MVLAALLLICSIPQMDDTAKAVVDSKPAADRLAAPPASSNNASKEPTKEPTLVASLPSAPAPKAKTDAALVEPNPAAQPFQPVKPVLTRPRETPRQRKMWYALTIASHTGAAFDAWSTHRAVVGGFGQEANPFLRPFAHSNAIYAATQASPAVMDYIGKRMMTSRDPWVRKLWWVPQLAGTGMSFFSGAHNVSLVH